ncbi:MAG: hypothetical protein M3R55_00940 [Acidobacteriota bacterium]|nr:hypothetical protein [Acidobacteriota bacterium]
MQATLTVPARRMIPASLVMAVLTAAMFATHIGLREFTTLHPGDPIRLTATSVLVLAFAGFVWTLVRGMKELDEFQKEMQLSALTFAFPASMVVLFAIGLFRGEGLLARMDPRDLVGVMLIAYAIGLAWAWRKYR